MRMQAWGDVLFWSFVFLTSFGRVGQDVASKAQASISTWPLAAIFFLDRVEYNDKNNVYALNLKGDVIHASEASSGRRFLLHIEGAKDFLNDTISRDFLSQYIKDDIEAPFKED